MSKKFNPSRTNRTPWTDKISLISKISTEDSEGYETFAEHLHIVYCTFADGINRNEFYEGMKAGIKLSAQVEVWQSDFNGEEICEHNGKRYNIIRSYETGRGTVELSLSEVVR